MGQEEVIRLLLLPETAIALQGSSTFIWMPIILFFTRTTNSCFSFLHVFSGLMDRNTLLKKGQEQFRWKMSKQMKKQLNFSVGSF